MSLDSCITERDTQAFLSAPLHNRATNGAIPNQHERILPQREAF